MSRYTIDDVADMTLKLIVKVESLETELRLEMKEGFDRMDRRFDRLERRVDRVEDDHEDLEIVVKESHEPRIIDLEKKAFKST